MSEKTIRPLGEWLKQRREERSISLEKAETETRIRIQYLRALENEEFQALPNPVVARGFLRNYASYLGLDTQEAVSRYSALAGPEEAPQPADQPVPMTADLFRPVPLHSGPGSRPSRRGLTFGLILIPVALVLLLAWGWWNYPLVTGWLSQLSANPPTATQTASGVITATLTPTGNPSPMPAATLTLAPKPTLIQAISPSPTKSPIPSPTPTSSNYTGVFVELNFIQKSWVQVTVDDVREFQGEVEAGTRQSYYGNESVALRIGNAGGVEVTVNGQNLGPLGGVDEVVDRVFETASTAATNTPEITPTIELTPTARSQPPTATAEPLRPTPLPPSPTTPITATAGTSP